MQLIGTMLTLLVRWPIWVASAFAMLLFVDFGSEWRLRIYLAIPISGTLILAAIDWVAFSKSFEWPSGWLAKFMACLAIEGVLSAFVCGATVIAFS